MNPWRYLPVALLVASTAGLASPGTLSAVGLAQDPAGSQPNIVVFYLDDTAPLDGRLWGDPSLTPEIYDLFVAHGVHFSNAIGETPLCCPARATLLTGLHTHNTGVKENDVRLFYPQESVAGELMSAGYDTMLIGKYMNRPEYLTGDLWTQHSASWSVFDVFSSPFNPDTGYFFNYTVTTKDGEVLTPTEHSTQWIGDRAVARMSATDRTRPIFALLSVSDTHLPNMPMPQFASDPRCDAMPPWNPPNYNEADMSDKPPWMADEPLFPYPGGWPMATLCREMLGIDWLVQRVTDELRNEGRLDNTLLVFTADNGTAWGAHRLELKETPYSTPVPLYLSWPARWGSEPRAIEDYTSDIDLAPTFCAAGGCSLGPYPGGQRGPDGVNLLPLVDGGISDLGRDALLETGYRTHAWTAVRTTNRNALGLWHYVEYAEGFRELYNVNPGADPFELDNLAWDPAYDGIRAALHERLLQLLGEGRPTATASLTIVQDTVPNSGLDFVFSGDFGSFTLDDDADAMTPREVTFYGLTPGSYAIDQLPIKSWSLGALTCSVATSADAAARHAFVNLLPGDHAACTFTAAQRRPDASIAVAGVGRFKGDNSYAGRPTSRQTTKRLHVSAGRSYDFMVNIQNDGVLVDSFKIHAIQKGSPTIPVTYYVDGLDVTPAVIAGTFTVPELATDAFRTMVVRVTVPVDAARGAKMNIVVRESSLGDLARKDIVRAIVTH